MPLGHPAGHFLPGGGELRGIVHHHKAFHPSAVDQQRQVVGRAFDCFFVVVLADGATDHHPRFHGQTTQHRVEDISADIIEIHIDAFRTFALEAGVDVFVFVIDGTVKTQFVDQELTLVRAPGNADYPATFDLGDLPGNACLLYTSPSPRDS